MIVCHCQAVSDRRIREEIASGAGDVHDVGRACEAGTVCGGCQPTIAHLLAECGRQGSPAGLVGARA